jgi:hypothetical protein
LRASLLTAILVLGSATISFAADSQFGAATTPNEVTVAPPKLVTIPDVRGQAYVFAKGTLEEGGFAWRVAGAVQGYPANTVVSQVPAAGTRVVDTGMPTIQLGLARNGGYAQEGAPENTSPYDGTAIKLPGQLKAAAKPKVRPKPVAKPKSKAPAKPKPKAAVKPKPISKPAARRGLPGRRRPTPSRSTRRADSQAGASSAGLPHRRPTTANVNHWLYQHVDRDRRAFRLVARRPGLEDPDPGRRAVRRWNIGSRAKPPRRRALAAAQEVAMSKLACARLRARLHADRARPGRARS